MAFLPNNQDQQNQQGQNTNQIPAVPQIPTLQGTSGGTTGAGAGAQSGVTNTATPGAAPSNPWQNVTTYLNANSGQAGNVADKIAGNLTSQYNTANQAIGQAQQDYTGKIQGARVGYDQNAVNTALANPSQYVQDPNNVTNFQKMYNANYAGPQDFSHTQDFSDLQGKVMAGQKQAGLVNQGTPGLMTLLQQAESEGGRNPTQGITALDSLLMQEDPNNFGKLSAAASPFAGLTGYLNNTQQGLDTAAQQAALDTANTKQSTQNAFNTATGQFTNAMNQKLQGAEKEAKNYNTEISDIMSRLSGGQQLTQQQLYDVDRSGGLSNLFGTFLNAQQFPGIGPGMLSQFYQVPIRGPQVAAPGMANVTSAEDYANAQALNQLSGQDLGLAHAPGTPWAVPTDKGSFNDTAAIQALYNQLNADQSYAPYFNDSQIKDYPTDLHALEGLLGGQIPINPIEQPLPPAPTLSGGTVDPTTGQTTYTPPPSGTTLTGGGRAFR